MSVAGRVRGVVERVAAASRRHDASSAAIARRAVALRARGIRLEEADLAGLLDPKLPLERCGDFVPRRALLPVLRRFNAGPKEAIDDKARFAVAAARHGLPVPRTLAVVSPPFAVDDHGRPVHEERAFRAWLEDTPASFVVKPAVGMGGRDVEFYERSGDRVSIRGREMTALELRRKLLGPGARGRAIVQERLRSHPALAGLSGSDALQCTRMVTVVTRAGAVELLFAFQKLIVGAHLVDNSVGVRTGNLVVSVDASGTLGAAYREGAPCPVHPVTGRTIAGSVVPDWDAARALVERAAQHFVSLRAIGWDVGHTADGPVLVEGNTEWVAFGERGFWYSTRDLARLEALY